MIYIIKVLDRCIISESNTFSIYHYQEEACAEHMFDDEVRVDHFCMRSGEMPS